MKTAWELIKELEEKGWIRLGAQGATVGPRGETLSHYIPWYQGNHPDGIEIVPVGDHSAFYEVMARPDVADQVRSAIEADYEEKQAEEVLTMSMVAVIVRKPDSDTAAAGVEHEVIGVYDGETALKVETELFDRGVDVILATLHPGIEAVWELGSQAAVATDRQGAAVCSTLWGTPGYIERNGIDITKVRRRVEDRLRKGQAAEVLQAAALLGVPVK